MAGSVQLKMSMRPERWSREVGGAGFAADRLSPIAMAAGAVTLGFVGEGAAEQAGWWLFVVSLFVFGMPHGGLDLLLARRLTRRRASTWRRVAGLYLATIGAAGLALWAIPMWTLTAFAALTAMHFGLADHRDLLEDGRDGPAPNLAAPSMLAGGIGRGLFMLGLPLACDAAGVLATLDGARAMLGVDGRSPAEGDLVFVGWAAVSCGALLTAAGVAAPPNRHRRAPHATRHLLEAAALVVAAWALPAITYVALYFVFWHSLRHFTRVLRLEPVTEKGGPGATPVRLAPALLRLHLWSLPLTVPVVAALLLIGGPGLGLQTPRQWATLVLLSFVVLTPAHHLLVEWTYARSVARGV